MFELAELKKIKKELSAALCKEAKKNINLLSNKDREKATQVFEVYKNKNSIAGLELFNTSVSEYFYFSDMLVDLDKKKTEFVTIKEFLIQSIKENFGNEDFRFLNLEREGLNHKQFKKEVLKFQGTAKIKFLEIQPSMVPEKISDFKRYIKSDSDPSTVGANVNTHLLKTPKEKIDQILKAKEILSNIWKEGYEIFELLTDKIQIVQSTSLVSYSHFHEQGISYINFIDRSLFQSVDDLIHENSHHHLNLILKKYKILIEENTEDIFYSPWRKELRSLYAILHAVFTFSYGSFLFYQMIKNKSYLEMETDFSMEEIYFRFLEETYSVEYSLYDLNICVKKKYFSKEGLYLIQVLNKKNMDNLKFIKSNTQIQLSKSQKQSTENLKKELNESRKKYILL